MDPGTALAVLGFIKPTAQTIIDAWQDVKHYGEDYRGLSLRLKASKTSLDHYDNILFTENKLPGIKGRLYDLLPENEQRTIFDMLGELALILRTYNATSKKYEVGRDTTVDENVHLEQERAERDVTLMTVNTSRNEEQAKLTGWMKKTWWTVWEKKSVEKLVRDFEKWIKRLHSLIKLIWGPLPFLTSLSQLQNLEKDDDAKQVGLLKDVPLRKLMVAPQGTQFLAIKNLKTTASTFSASADHPNYGSVGPFSKVFVEYKSYQVDNINRIQDLASSRISQLIALLHEAKDHRFKVLRCVQYFDESPRPRVGLIFQLPTQLNGPPSNLLHALNCSSNSRPSLNARMKLARSLSDTVLLLHSVNWLHKSIRSENVLLLTGIDFSSFRDKIPNLEHPRLSGFEYSRLVTDGTGFHFDYKVEHNIYRHPRRWNDPLEAFSKIHDIYALGVILLEIGLWEPIINLDKKDGPPAERFPNGSSTRDRLLRHARKRLGFYAGEKYQDLVCRCLNGDSGDLKGDDMTGFKLQQMVTEGISHALGPLEDLEDG